ncbi:MAG TPA: hypothetical protein VGL68_01940 [Solirubrobacteraceae bacterium]|jgi:hypothetical protein
MSGSGYRALGYAVWHGGKWYLRRRLPSARVLSVGAAAAASALAAAALIARRNGS